MASVGLALKKTAKLGGLGGDSPLKAYRRQSPLILRRLADIADLLALTTRNEGKASVDQKRNHP
jgi:hypothetical protein